MIPDEILKKENPELYRIAREGGTERPGTSEYLEIDDDGVFHCALCGTPLFKTDEKFDSGTGWPSFTEPITPQAVKHIPDDSHGMVRTEVRCATCDAHLGHIFPDGPRRVDGTHADRYCINGICLNLEND